LTPRSELKYYIPMAYARLLEMRLSTVLRRDRHTAANGFYRIRSLYFDDPDLAAYHDKLGGFRDRVKWRLRYYNDDVGYIRLEEKRKQGSLSFKSYTSLPFSVAEDLALSRDLKMTAPPPLLEAFLLKREAERMRPTLFVEYERRAFLYPAGNVRVTLDSSLRAAPFRGDLASPPPAFPVLDGEEVILEVKFDSFLPPFITQLLEDVPKTPSAISKYSQCMERIGSIVC